MTDMLEKLYAAKAVARAADEAREPLDVVRARAVTRAAERRPFRAALLARRRPGDRRRDQARLAVGRPDRARARSGRDRARVRSRRRRRDQRAHRSRPLSRRPRLRRHRARARRTLPILRKDFMRTRYDVAQSAAYGADCVLAIVAGLDDARAARDVRRSGALRARRAGRSARRSRAARARSRVGATLLGINNRDLRTFETNLAVTAELLPLVPPAIVVISESGVRSREDVQPLLRGRRARIPHRRIADARDRQGRAAARAARRRRTGMSGRTRVKICGCTSVADVEARGRCRRRRDRRDLRRIAAPGDAGRGARDRAQRAAVRDRGRRAWSTRTRRSSPSVLALGLRAAVLGRRVARVLRGCRRRPLRESAALRARTASHAGRRRSARPTRYPDARPDVRFARRADSTAAPGPRSAGRWSKASRARRRVIVSGGLDARERRRRACASVRPFGVDVRSGVETRRRQRSGRRCARSCAPCGKSTKGHRLQKPDARGYFGAFGGKFVPEVLVGALDRARGGDERRRSPIRRSGASITRAARLRRAAVADLSSRARSPGRTPRRSVFKREDLNHTGAHKINNTVGQALLAQRMGKTRFIAETGAGQHGVATATVGAKFGVPVDVFMGAVDVERQALNVYVMKLLGATVHPVESGTRTLKDATNEAFREWAGARRGYVLHHRQRRRRASVSVHGARVPEGDRRRSARARCSNATAACRRDVVACVGGGSNAMGIFAGFVDDPDVKLWGVEAAGHGVHAIDTAASINAGTIGILHGSRSYVLADAAKVKCATRIRSRAGLDYPGVGPEHAFLSDSRPRDVRRRRPTTKRSPPSI